MARRGYWGDILVSPYISFGIESDNQQLFKKANNTYIKVGLTIQRFPRFQFAAFVVDPAYKPFSLLTQLCSQTIFYHSVLNM